MNIHLDMNSIDDYQLFLRAKSLPTYRIIGRSVWFPDEYSEYVIGQVEEATKHTDYDPPSWMYDYQKDIAQIAVRRKKFALFVECGLGKTAIFLDFARHAASTMPTKRVLIVSPLMVISQTIAEAERFYGDVLPLHRVKPADLQTWLDSPNDGSIGITNYESIRPELTRGNLGGLILDESSLLKSHYGKWGTKILEMGKGLEWKMAATGTPAPNDRIEYANHAVFMDAYPNVNSFLARFFVNKGQTCERWTLKQHALAPFYVALSHWSIFLTNPATYGWTDNSASIPKIIVHEHDVPLTTEQEKLAFGMTGRLFSDRIGGITNRSVLSQIAKGNHKGMAVPTNKPRFIADLVGSWPDESTIVWCRFNAEQETLEQAMPEAASMSGNTPDERRQEIIAAFKAGQVKTLISKPKILGFGLNLQIATRQVFSSCEDSYEEYHQAVKRSNRIGSTRPLNVHLPVTDIERLQMENVLRKARRVQQDTDEQEQIFRSVGIVEYRS